VGPTVCYSPGAISMKEDWVQGAPLHSHTQTSYAGTRAFMCHRVYMPAIFNVARGLLSPMQWCGRRFSATGQRVNGTILRTMDFTIIQKHKKRKKLFIWKSRVNCEGVPWKEGYPHTVRLHE